MNGSTIAPVAVVTGAAGGLGRAITRILVERRWHVVAVDRMGRLAAPDWWATDDAKSVLPLECDLATPHSVIEMWSAACASFGNPSVVINCAGVWRSVPFTELSLDEWEATVAVNLTAPFVLTQCAVRSWVDRGEGGSVVNVASVAALRSNGNGASAYGASKAGLVGLTTHLAVELGPLGVRVNAVAPGSFRSPMNTERLSRPGEEERSRSLVPLRRLGEAADVASVVVYLALDAHYVNGVVLPVDGGRVATM